jgi:hypothetical protein
LRCCAGTAPVAEKFVVEAPYYDEPIYESFSSLRSRTHDNTHFNLFFLTNSTFVSPSSLVASRSPRRNERTANRSFVLYGDEIRTIADGVLAVRDHFLPLFDTSDNVCAVGTRPALADGRRR